MANTPHSDKSGRAARRREERGVAKAQNTVARAQTRPVEGSPNITVNDLLCKIGALTVERDALQAQRDQALALFNNLAAKSTTDAGAFEDTEGEVPEEVPADPTTPGEEPDDGPPAGRTGE